jgi:hypothetical protein
MSEPAWARLRGQINDEDGVLLLRAVAVELQKQKLR